MAYMTKDFAKKQTRKFTVYYNDKEDKVEIERELQKEEHENRSIISENTLKHSSKKKKSKSVGE